MFRALSAPGVWGVVVGVLIFVSCYAFATLAIKPLEKGLGYKIDHNGPRSFEPGMARYTRLVEFQIGLATGSIVLLGGSSFLHPADKLAVGHLPRPYGSPLVLLAMSVIPSLLFISVFMYSYEESLHDPKFYRHHVYRFVTALGFSGLLCFAIGYIWLAFALVSTDVHMTGHDSSGEQTLLVGPQWRPTP
jgi:hypothetical protein